MVGLENKGRAHIYTFVGKRDYRNSYGVRKYQICYRWCTIFMVTAGWDEGDEELTEEFDLFMDFIFFSIDLTRRNHHYLDIMNWPYPCPYLFTYTLKFLLILLNLVFLNIHTQFCILLLTQKLLFITLQPF